MKVLCINNKPIRGLANGHLEMIQEGAIYTVDTNVNSCVLYVLLEATRIEPDGEIIAFSKKRFIPLSDIDETQLIKERTLKCYPGKGKSKI